MPIGPLICQHPSAAALTANGPLFEKTVETIWVVVGHFWLTPDGRGVDCTIGWHKTISTLHTDTIPIGPPPRHIFWGLQSLKAELFEQSHGLI